MAAHTLQQHNKKSKKLTSDWVLTFSPSTTRKKTHTKKRNNNKELLERTSFQRTSKIRSLLDHTTTSEQSSAIKQLTFLNGLGAASGANTTRNGHKNLQPFLLLWDRSLGNCYVPRYVHPKNQMVNQIIHTN